MVVLGILVIILRGEYFILNGVSSDELYPVSSFIGRVENEILEISYVSWTILSFNVTRIVKE